MRKDSSVRIPRTIALLGFLLAPGCGGGDSGGTDAGGGAIALTGVLVEGAQTPGTEMSMHATRAAGDPLVGYQLYCVTFADPPTAGTATADQNGQVVLEIAAQGIPFGCFILDAAGDPAATLIFMSGGQESQTITLTEDTNLGQIDVDLDHGVAEGDLGSADSLTGSEDLTCPLGTWFASVTREDCEGTTVRVWIARETNGQYTVSYTIGPIWMSDVQACVDHSETGLPVTESDGTLSFSSQHDAVGCPSRLMTLAMTPNGACTETAVHMSYGPCLSCDEGQCGCEEGTLTCTADYTLTRD